MAQSIWHWFWYGWYVSFSFGALTPNLVSFSGWGIYINVVIGHIWPPLSRWSMPRNRKKRPADTSRRDITLENISFASLFLLFAFFLILISLPCPFHHLCCSYLFLVPNTSMPRMLLNTTHSALYTIIGCSAHSCSSCWHNISWWYCGKCIKWINGDLIVMLYKLYYLPQFSCFLYFKDSLVISIWFFFISSLCDTATAFAYGRRVAALACVSP